MALIKLAALGALGYVGYKFYEKSKSEGSAAFASGQPAGGIRDAGPAAMADAPGGGPAGWSKVDQQSDESFPASDPPANY